MDPWRICSDNHDKTSSFFLDASILEANLCLTELGAIASFNNMPLPQRMGINRFAPTYPLGIWPCKDGWLGVTVLNPGQWLAFCELLGLPDLAGNPEYQSSMARLNAAADYRAKNPRGARYQKCRGPVLSRTGQAYSTGESAHDGSNCFLSTNTESAKCLAHLRQRGFDLRGRAVRLD